jgi:cytochrome c-type biogenesis protein CcmH/NrfF
VDSPGRPSPESATLPHRGSLWVAPVVGLLLVGAALALALRRRSGPGTAAR